MPRKLKPKWLGPCKVIGHNYQHQNYMRDLNIATGLEGIHNVFHVELLESFKDNNSLKFPNREQPQPGPVTGDRWEVEKILEFRMQTSTKKPQYTVRWMGYTHDQDPWVPAKDIDSEILCKLWATEGNIEEVNNSQGSTEDRLQLIQNKRNRAFNEHMMSALT